MRRIADLPERPSRTKRKHAAEAVTELAHELAELPEATFRRLPLPDDLRAEFAQVRGMKASAARERQLRHLGGALRDDADVLEQLREVLAGHSQAQRDEARLLHQLEGLRTRLCDPQQSAAALTEAATAYPALDGAALRHQLELYRRDADKKAFRTIFRLLAAAAGG